MDSGDENQESRTKKFYNLLIISISYFCHNLCLLHRKLHSFAKIVFC